MSHLTLSQRYEISALHQAQHNAAFIATQLSIHRSTVYRELERNRAGGHYRAEEANRRACFRQYRRKEKRKRTEAMEVHIAEKLALKQTPEQILGKAILDKVPMISIPSIYQYIYQDKEKGGELYSLLPQKHSKRRKRKPKSAETTQITNKVSIEQRPSIVEERSRPGDWEGDTIIGSAHKQVIVTMVDRKTGYLLMKKVANKKADMINEAIFTLIKDNPFPIPIQTITFDNGTEFAGHKALQEILNTSIYFAHPYHSWERGTNENTNGLVRRFFPKGTDFTQISEKQIEEAQMSINNRPRKRLGFLSPIEFINLHYLTNSIVAFTT